MPDPIEYCNEKSDKLDLAFLERADSARGIFPLNYMHVRFCQRNTEQNRFLHLGDQFGQSLKLHPILGDITLFVKDLVDLRHQNHR